MTPLFQESFGRVTGLLVGFILIFGPFPRADAASNPPLSELSDQRWQPNRNRPRPGSDAQPDVWLCAGERINDLLHPEAEWPFVRQHLSGIKLYVDQINKAAPEQLAALVRLAKNHRHQIAVELGGCLDFAPMDDKAGEWSARHELAKIEKFYAAGGQVDFLDIDGPIRRLMHPENRPDRQRFDSIEKAADELVDALRVHQQAHPETKFWLLSNFPNWGYRGDVSYHARGPKRQDYGDDDEAVGVVLRKLRAAEIPLAGVTVDNPYDYLMGEYSSVNLRDPKSVNWLQRVRTYEDFAREQGLEFNLIVNSERGGQESDELFYRETLQMVDIYRNAGGRPTRWFVQSWYPYPKQIVPETAPHSMTALVKAVIERVSDRLAAQSRTGLPARSRAETPDRPPPVTAVDSIRRTESGAILVEDFDSPQLDQTRWRVWQQNADLTKVRQAEGRLALSGRGELEHNGLWGLVTAKYKDVVLVGEMDIRSDGGPGHRLALHLCGGDGARSPDHWVEIDMVDLGEKARFSAMAALPIGLERRQDQFLELPRIPDRGFLCRVTLNSATGLAELDVKTTDGWRAVCAPIELPLRTVHAEIKLHGNQGSPESARNTVSEAWFDQVRIYPRPENHHVGIRLVRPNGGPIWFRENDGWPPKITDPAGRNRSIEDLEVQLWTADGRTMVTGVRSANMGFYLLPLKNAPWDVYPVAAQVRVVLDGKLLGPPLQIESRDVDGLYPDDVFDVVIRESSTKRVASTGSELPLADRISTRTFPSAFQAWNAAENVDDPSPLHTVARHDLVFHAPEFFGLRWNHGHTGLADGFSPESIEAARVFRQKLLELNPRLVLLTEIRYRDAPKSYLPEGHSWWLRDAEGRLVSGWEEGGFLCLNFHDPEYRSQVVKQAKAAVDSGAVDGVMLDWWSDDASRLALVKELRQAVGDDALIMANSNDRTTTQTGPYLNGYFMECYKSQTAQDWKRIADTLAWAEEHLRPPRVNCLETWFHKSRQDLDLMRATTTLALTHSDGYCLFSDPNPLPKPDHLHNWYPFWNKRLGRPTAKGQKLSDGTVRREFEQGTVVYNPMGNQPVRVTFPQPQISLATGKKGLVHRLGSPDGDIYLSTASSGRIALQPQPGAMQVTARVPALDNQAFALGVPETIGCREAMLVNFPEARIDWQGPDLEGVVSCSWGQGGRIFYSLRLIPAEDYVDVEMTIRNHTEFLWHDVFAFNCLNPIQAPVFKDWKLERTYMSAQGRPLQMSQTTRVKGHMPTVGFYLPERIQVGQESVFVRGFGATSPDRTDGSWIATLSEPAGAYMAATAMKAAFLFDNLDRCCIHAAPGFGDIGPGEASTTVSRLYLAKGTLDIFLKRQEADRPALAARQKWARGVGSAVDSKGSRGSAPAGGSQAVAAASLVTAEVAAQSQAPPGVLRRTDWVRAGLSTNLLIWGIRGGLLWGLPPATGQPSDGPRGLIRLRYPVLPNGGYDLLNFIAVEPVVRGQRGYSELEPSQLDGVSGKRLEVNESNTSSERATTVLAGRLTRLDTGAERLTVEVAVERFENGAHVRLTLSQVSDAPDALELTVHPEPDSAPIEYCILSATMGNKARARRLWLKAGAVSSLDLYRDYKESGFTPHRVFPLKRLRQTSAGDVLAAITTDEVDPATIDPHPAASHWRYGGFPVTQYWRKPAGTWRDDLQVAVNGRFTYWMSHHPIPGGIAFENFEMRERFHPGQRFVFGITRRTPGEQSLGVAREEPGIELAKWDDAGTHRSSTGPGGTEWDAPYRSFIQTDASATSKGLPNHAEAARQILTDAEKGPDTLRRHKEWVLYIKHFSQAYRPESATADLKRLYEELVVLTPGATAAVAKLPFSGESRLTIHRDVVYGRSHPEIQKLDAYLVKSDQPTPVVIEIHGGGWRRGSKSQFVYQGRLMDAILDAGISVVSIDYRLTPQHTMPSQMEDVARALQFVRTKAKEWNLNPDRIAALGGSAGAHLGAWIALHDDLAKPDSADPVERSSSRLTGFVAISGPMDLTRVRPSELARQALRGQDFANAFTQAFGCTAQQFEADASVRQRIREASPLFLVSPDDPPGFLIAASREDLAVQRDPPVPSVINDPHSVWHSVLLRDAMRRAGANATCRLGPEVGRSPVADNAAILEFLRENLGIGRRASSQDSSGHTDRE